MIVFAELLISAVAKVATFLIIGLCFVGTVWLFKGA
jgi:hypothetical protein